MTDITIEELRAVAPCPQCAGLGSSGCSHCQYTMVSPALNHSALAELIRARCEAAWEAGAIAGYADCDDEWGSGKEDPPAAPAPRRVNPFAKGGA